MRLNNWRDARRNGLAVGGTMEANVAEQKFIQRWESRDEARERMLVQYQDLIMTALDIETMTDMQTHSISAIRSLPILLHHMCVDPEGKTMSSATKRERDGMVQAYPELKITPLVHRYAIIDDNARTPMIDDESGGDDPKSGATAYPTMSWTSPVLVEGVGLGPVVLAGYRLKYANGGGDDEAFLVTKREIGPAAPTALVNRYFKIQNEVSHQVRRIEIWGEGQSPEIPKQSWTTWDQIFLDAKAAQAVRDDLIFFVNNEKAFREAEIPYKRGYLIHGPPGNGKTTICRAIATSMPFASYGFDFSNPDWENRDLTMAFRNAAKHAPAAFFLEDIDRVWAEEKGSNESKITLDHLLNCLDGIQTNDGLIVVATANNPKVIDPAILSRPGRFDAIVELGNPDLDLRKRYLKYLFRKTDLTDENIQAVAEASEGASMCYVKEIFIQTMRSAIERRRRVCVLDTEWAVPKVMDMFEGANNVTHREAGFK